MKKKKKFHSQANLRISCLNNKKAVYLPNDNTIFQSVKTDSWFSIKQTNNNAKLSISKLDTTDDNYYARKFFFYPTDQQKNILRQWFKATTFLYNKSLKEIKNIQYFKPDCPEKLTFFSIRKKMKEIKTQILEITKIPVHILDLTIKKCVENYKSIITNFQKHNISKFRYRYYKYDNSHRKTIYLEPAHVKKNGDISQLGSVKLVDMETHLEYKLEKKNINHHFEIKYSNDDKKYYMILIFKSNKKKVKIPKEEFISIDPGVSPFLTGVSKDNCTFIEENTYMKLNADIKDIDRCENSGLKPSKKRKHIRNKRRKIKNKVDDMHWKTINYLTSKYNKILIGDLSVKEIVESDGIAKISKRILHNLRLFVFKLRLQTRCNELGIEYKEINEYMTSKTCSMCGNIKMDLGKEKIYKCDNCKIIMQRDINGARCIYYVSMI